MHYLFFPRIHVKHESMAQGTKVHFKSTFSMLVLEVGCYQSILNQILKIK